MSADPVHDADAVAIAAVLEVEPAWVGLRSAREMLGLDEKTLLHAGPRFADPSEVTKPILNSACVAAVFEGLAADFRQAEEMILSNDLELSPAQDLDVVVPLAAVVSASMMLQVVTDGDGGNQSTYAPINGGGGPAMRLGLRTESVLDHLRWLNGEFAETLTEAHHSPIELISFARRGIDLGDDCHGLTSAATQELARHLTPRLPNSHAGTRARNFLAQGPSFFLNLWMAACKCMLKAAVGCEASSLLTGAGGNGREVGIQVAGLPGRWFVARADAPKGRLQPGIPENRALGAIGDSAIVDALGFGAMAMSFSPAQQKALLPFMPEGGLDLSSTMMLAEHPGFSSLRLRVGLAARNVVTCRREPVVSLGILDLAGVEGRLGGGIYRIPLTLFDDALSALEAQT